MDSYARFVSLESFLINCISLILTQFLTFRAWFPSKFCEIFQSLTKAAAVVILNRLLTVSN